jgi:lysophospholipase L1-like esterase
MARNLLLLVVSIALGLAAAEAVLSRVRPMPLRHIRSGTIDFERAPKARWYGWANVPGETFTTNDPDAGAPITYRINSEGWHDVEHEREAQGRTRILVVGDSFTMGYVELDELYTRRLEEMLVSKGFPVEVISMGMNGFSTDQELEVIRREAWAYAPDVVLYQYYPNDDEGNFFPYRGDPATGAYAYPEAFPPTFRWPVEHKLFRYDVIDGALRKRDFLTPEYLSDRTHWIAFNAAFEKAMRHSALLYHASLLFKRIGWTRYFRYDTWLDETRLPERDTQPPDQKLIGLVELMHEECAAHGARLGVFALDMSRELVAALRAAAGGRYFVLAPSRRYQRYQNDEHANPTGNRQMAEDLAEQLTGSGSLLRR